MSPIQGMSAKPAESKFTPEQNKLAEKAMQEAIARKQKEMAARHGK